MKKTNIVLLIMIAACVAALVMTIGDFSTYETFATANAKEGKIYHVVGALDTTKTIHYDAQKDANYFTFYMKDKSGEIRKVIYNGTRPTDFDKSTELVLTGKMKNGEFYCNKILMKCPSKYKDQQTVSSGREV
ncbi:cytochrome c maturation protein CcmE [Chitinophaga horti]|uniref:Cytochrome c maturation protein CcmE n=1 Tax=Chitinophaga horti TaxID=2920382 RepID=A0ABY6J8W4_9BACT|nr:cytochrome c maturation protein CcmE [Chitinophaga horti]UYQ94757.1 cytochrome c maturation protein CcmE [Chitinophaga horti]